MKGIRIRPEERGSRATLFDLESDIMEVVWTNGWSWFAVGQVHELLRLGREVAYTTIMTTVARLEKKGILTRKRDGRRYLYQARYSRESFAQAMASEVLDSLAVGSQDAAIALLVDRVSKADADELAKLEKVIRARRRELKR